MATKDSAKTEEANILRMHDLRPAPGANRDRIRVGVVKDLRARLQAEA